MKKVFVPPYPKPSKGIIVKSHVKGSPTAYCVVCKSKKTMANVKHIKMKNGRPASKGVCPVCGTGMFRIG